MNMYKSGFFQNAIAKSSYIIARNLKNPKNQHFTIYDLYFDTLVARLLWSAFLAHKAP